MTRFWQSSDRQRTLHYVESGRGGPTLLLLPGVTRRGMDWAPVLPALNPSWRLVLLDQRGHGPSSRADRYLVNDYVADAVEFVKSELAEPLAIVGHSLGAMVAAAVAAELPSLVTRVVLEDPPFQTMGNRIAGSSWSYQFAGMREAARRSGSVAEIADMLAEIQLPVGDGPFRRLGDLRDRSSLLWSAECLQTIDPELLTPVIEGRWLEGYDMGAIFSRVRCPTLVLQADPAAGGALTDADARLMVSLCPGCHHVQFPGAGHLLHRERTDAVVEELLRFLSASFADWGHE